MSARPVALVTGVTGQDGVHLARLLVAEGCRVIGTHRPGSPAAAAMRPYLREVELVGLDLCDEEGFASLVRDVRPAEVYNLAAMSSVGQSWQEPEAAMALNGAAPTAMLRALEAVPQARFLQAASAEQSGEAAASPYARGKRLGHEAVVAARDSGRFAVAAVLHIHESPLRRPTFVVRKITRAAAAISLGRQQRLTLGSLGIRRDWGAAADHVRAMRLMLASDTPADHEVATGVLTSLSTVVELAFAAAGISDPWTLVDFDEALERPVDAAVLAGDPAPLRSALGWEPRHSLAETVAAMVAVDRERLVSGVEEAEHYLDRLRTSPAAP
ncbi:NAD-dependent epimerase/dehydratase family protein [Nocardioides albidus]|uniref:GDP-mannose 4,6-dehydratase n=1 Tax=Nocardioides albidus TaxID=1517589 RepID=A0A5C4W744_9ACTN|nr:GDP-mannose 4,6-dehydratase [Nocardioides albidus]TNM44144.1 NAD-dependent epimerase/dehydratase family protein [Nocardioides albidus]